MEIRDKRVSAQTQEESPETAVPEVEATVEPDYKDLYLRSEAALANFRKQTMKRSADDLARAKGQFVKKLLPIIDNFERAISHGEGGEGVALVLKELQALLAAEGVEEVSGEGAAFDPTIHDAVQTHEDPDVEVDTVAEVHRRGYRMGDALLRPAMVVVARPVENIGEGTR